MMSGLRSESIDRCIRGGVDQCKALEAAYGVCVVKLMSSEETVVLLDGEDITGEVAEVMILPARQAFVKRHLRDDGHSFWIQPDGPDGAKEVAAVWIKVYEIRMEGWMAKWGKTNEGS